MENPIDRWSKRVIGTLAKQMGAQAHYPFGGPPHAPFVSWALDSGRVFSSPTKVMVHDTMGMMISFRGALLFDQEFDIPAPRLSDSPCHGCVDKPCTTTCPVGAMNAQGNFLVKDCYDFIAQTGECVTKGCLARSACPLSQKSGRNPEQTSHHMSYCKF
ncbi:ferredoxin [Aliisedimentitalea scapharcae]|uniref:Ferredoxin n=1 Tax=Aliisedimentitalea scapharcae TaxID=1524259 RepID=A0ABZ2XTH2_9RHOB